MNPIDNEIYTLTVLLTLVLLLLGVGNVTLHIRACYIYGRLCHAFYTTSHGVTVLVSVVTYTGALNIFVLFSGKISRSLSNHYLTLTK